MCPPLLQHLGSTHLHIYSIGVRGPSQNTTPLFKLQIPYFNLWRETVGTPSIGNTHARKHVQSWPTFKTTQIHCTNGPQKEFSNFISNIWPWVNILHLLAKLQVLTKRAYTAAFIDCRALLLWYLTSVAFLPHTSPCCSPSDVPRLGTHVV